jgi:hypothetical protein
VAFLFGLELSDAMNESRTMHNFVAAMPDTVTIESPRADLVRRQDVVQTVDRLITAYSDQQGALLSQVQQDATGSGFLSNAQQVDARRRMSRMYLTHQTTVTGMVAAGVVGIAYLAGAVDGGGAFVGWLALTGITALVLSTAMHRQEIRHSPEGIARHLLDWHGSIAEYESETRRLSLQWEHAAEERRQAGVDRAAEHGRQLAELRVKELDARRRTIEAQTERRMYAEPAQTAIAGAGRTEAALQVSDIQSDDATLTGGATGDGWQAALVTWVVTLYEPGNVTEGGVIKGRVPWAARSSWTEADKREAQRVCVSMRPALIEQVEGGRWRLRREMFADADQAMYILSPRLS